MAGFGAFRAKRRSDTNNTATTSAKPDTDRRSQSQPAYCAPWEHPMNGAAIASDARGPTLLFSSGRRGLSPSDLRARVQRASPEPGCHDPQPAQDVLALSKLIQ
jgi:hypothetical protein